ncbi:MAG: hypothetical protein ACRCXZ_02995 [Patescibacteria group bacterium]
MSDLVLAPVNQIAKYNGNQYQFKQYQGQDIIVLEINGRIAFVFESHNAKFALDIQFKLGLMIVNFDGYHLEFSAKGDVFLAGSFKGKAISVEEINQQIDQINNNIEYKLDKVHSDIDASLDRVNRQVSRVNSNKYFH